MTTLPTGVTVATGTLKTTTLTLHKLWDALPIVAFELLALARDPQHQLFGNAGAMQRGCNLIDGHGRMYPDTRAVVLASFTGEDLDAEFRPLTW